MLVMMIGNRQIHDMGVDAATRALEAKITDNQTELSHVRCCLPIDRWIDCSIHSLKHSTPD